jgi:hypothetical protein
MNRIFQVEADQVAGSSSSQSPSLGSFMVSLTYSIEARLIPDWITYPFGLYSTTITSVADKEGTLYTSIGWGCLINAFYIVRPQLKLS